METKTKNGVGSKTDAATTTKDTSKGVGTMAIVTAKNEMPSSPIAERLKKIHEFHTLSERRKLLLETQDDLFEFESGMTENDRITLTNGKRETVEIKKGDAVKKVLELLKAEVEGAIKLTDADLLGASL